MSSNLTSFIEAVKAHFPEKAVVTDVDQLEKYRTEWRRIYHSDNQVALLPDSTQQLSEMIQLCAKYQIPIVPQGGNTGLVGGCVAGSDQVIISTARMNRILSIDPINYTMTVEAGAILANIQNAAQEQGCLFPLSLGAEGSCVIGGNIASNAGGVGVLKYGNTRELVLGLEVVLPDGRIWNGMRPLRKDNSGYSLKNLFIGSEGTLGIITKAILKLFPGVRQVETAFCAIPNVQSALSLLSLSREMSGDQVTAFELISEFALTIVEEHSDAKSPLTQRSGWYALIELSTSRQGNDLREAFEQILAKGFETGLIEDAVIAESLAHRQSFWALREGIPECQTKYGGSIKHDISVPVSDIPDFINQAGEAVARYMLDINMCAFGHVGDGNVHFNFSQPKDMDKKEFLSHWDAVNKLVHDTVVQFGGSISAEHGIGLLKLEEIRHYRSSIDQQLLDSIKQAIDPKTLLNPGKLI